MYFPGLKGYYSVVPTSFQRPVSTTTFWIKLLIHLMGRQNSGHRLSSSRLSRVLAYITTIMVHFGICWQRISLKYNMLGGSFKQSVGVMKQERAVKAPRHQTDLFPNSSESVQMLQTANSWPGVFQSVCVCSVDFQLQLHFIHFSLGFHLHNIRWAAHGGGLLSITQSLWDSPFGGFSQSGPKPHTKRMHNYT